MEKNDLKKINNDNKKSENNKNLYNDDELNSHKQASNYFYNDDLENFNFLAEDNLSRGKSEYSENELVRRNEELINNMEKKEENRESVSERNFLIIRIFILISVNLLCCLFILGFANIFFTNNILVIQKFRNSNLINFQTNDFFLLGMFCLFFGNN